MDYRQNFRKFPIWVKKNSNISIFVKIFENVILVKIFEQHRFWSQFSKICILLKMLEILILVNIFEKYWFLQNFS